MPQGTVSWFNADKGFGFVAADEDGPDVFLHVSSVAGHPPQEGDRVEYDVRQGDRGPQAEHVRVLDDGPVAGGEDVGGEDVVVLQGTVSWFSPDKGFGFVVPDDVFVHGSAVVGGRLEPGARVVFELRMGDRGPQAEQVRALAVPPRGRDTGQDPGRGWGSRDTSRGPGRDTDRDTGRRSGPARAAGGPGTGAVAWFDAGKGFGFLTPDDGSDDLFVHISSVAGAQVLEEGQRVRYAVQEGPRGPVAVDVGPVP